MSNALALIGVSVSVVGVGVAVLTGLAAWCQRPRLRHRIQQLQSVAAALPTESLSRQQLTHVIALEAKRLALLESRWIQRRIVHGATSERRMLALAAAEFVVSAGINVAWSAELGPSAPAAEVLPFLIPSYVLMLAWMLTLAVVITRRRVRRQYGDRD
ncbi:MAG TPA: hypothetical protein VHO27_10425 [Angustibacter sp.]|nr:hypothetical protein [Angustibacter sp.]